MVNRLFKQLLSTHAHGDVKKEALSGGLEIFFIISILVGTGTDFIARQLLPDLGLVVNCVCVVSLFLAACSFYLIMNSAKYTDHSAVLSQGVKNNSTTLQLRPIDALLNSNDPLLIVRFLAAFLVFVTHIAILLHPKEELLTGYWSVLRGGAHAGMAVFFTLSGFLMGKAFITGRYTLTREGIFTFYKSRWIRIFPLMSFVFIFLFVLQYPQVLRFDPLSIMRLMTFNYYGNTIGLNGIGAMWSLSVEFQYYLMAPFVFLLFHDRVTRNRIKGIAAVVAAIIFFTLLKYFAKKYLFNKEGLYDPAFFSLLGNLPFFLTGFLFNYIPFNISERSAKLITNGWVLIIGMSLFYLMCNSHGSSVLYFVFVSILTGFAISTLDGIRKTTAFLTLGKCSLFKVFQVLGVLSYGFYLWHSGIGYVHSQLFPNGFSNHLPYLIESSIVGGIVLLISFITFVLVEDRFNAYKPINRFTKD